MRCKMTLDELYVGHDDLKEEDKFANVHANPKAKFQEHMYPEHFQPRPQI